MSIESTWVALAGKYNNLCVAQSSQSTPLGREKPLERSQPHRPNLEGIDVIGNILDFESKITGS